MKTITLLFLAVTTISAWTQGVEPSGDMTVKPSAVFSCDVTLIENRIVETLGQLQGVEHNTQSGGQRFQRREWKPDFPKDSWMAKNCALMSLAIFEVQWMPPKPPSQKTSNGGGNIKPVSSKITIDSGYLKTNCQAVVVRLSRESAYNPRTHIAYNQISLWHRT